MNTKYAAFASILAVGFASHAHAAGVLEGYVPTYNITVTAPNPIEDIAMFWTAPGQGIGMSWQNYAFGYPNGFVAGGDSQTTFLQDQPGAPKPVLPSGLLVLGVYSDSEGQHLALFMDPTTGTAEEGIAFGAVFPNTNENAVINDLVQIATTDNWVAGAIFSFVGGDAQTIPNGDSTLSAWLTPAPSGVPTAGKIEMWSSGTVIGSFSAAATPTYATSTPAPAAIVPFLVGALGLRRRRSAK